VVGIGITLPQGKRPRVFVIPHLSRGCDPWADPFYRRHVEARMKTNRKALMVVKADYFGAALGGPERREKICGEWSSSK